jgi:hypothetical protein
MMKRCFLLSTLSLTFLITFATFALAQRPSPAGGGWLEFGGEDSFAVARDDGSFSIGNQTFL